MPIWDFIDFSSLHPDGIMDSEQHQQWVIPHTSWAAIYTLPPLRMSSHTRYLAFSLISFSSVIRPCYGGRNKRTTSSQWITASLCSSRSWDYRRKKLLVFSQHLKVILLPILYCKMQLDAYSFSQFTNRISVISTLLSHNKTNLALWQHESVNRIRGGWANGEQYNMCIGMWKEFPV